MAAWVGAGCSSASGSNAAENDQLDAFVRSFCVDPRAVADDSFRPEGLPEAAAPAVQQHVKVGECEAYLSFFLDRGANAYWESIATNCTMFSLLGDGGYVPNNGFPPDCFVKPTATGPVDPFAAGTVCICCAGGECGRFCHPRMFDSGRGGITCASYNNDFQTPLIDDPRNHPDLCDCSGF